MTGGNADEVNLAAISERLQSINRVVRNTASQTSTVTSGAVDPDAVATPVSSDEPSSAASEHSESKSSSSIDELSLDDEDSDENRNKR